MNYLVIDFETSSPNRYACKIVYRGESIPPEPRKKLDALVMHNAEFDLYLLENRQGMKTSHCQIFDTMLMAKHWRNDLPAYDLKSLAWWILGELPTKRAKLMAWIRKHENVDDPIEFDLSKCPIDLVEDYCQQDVDFTNRIFQYFYPKVKDNPAFQLDMQLIRLVSKAEDHGFTLDKEYYHEYLRRSSRRIKDNTRLAKDLLHIGRGDKRKPTGHAIREHLQSLGEQRTTASGMVAADELALRDHKGDQAVRAVSRIRSDQKEANTYINNLLLAAGDSNKVHPHLIQSGAITRRFRASGFYGDNGVIAKGNAQNFPREGGVRRGITVPEGYWFVKLDLASIEARLGAHAMAVFCDNTKYVDQYKKNDKFNIYLDVAWECENSPKITKKDHLYTAYKHGCLGIQYGVGEEAFYKTMHDKFDLPMSVYDCQEIYRKIRRTRPEFGRLQRAVSSIIEKQGYILDDFGAIYYVPEAEKYKGVNYYCQGCAGNILKWWWIEVDKMLTEDFIFNSIHDELDMAVKKDKSAKKRVKMYCNVLDKLDLFSLPIKAEASDLVTNWGEAG